MRDTQGETEKLNRNEKEAAHTKERSTHRFVSVVIHIVSDANVPTAAPIL